MSQAKDSKWFATLLKTEELFTKIIESVCTGWFLLMNAVMLWQVISRFVLNLSVPWTDELSRYLWVTIAFLGAGAAITRDAHIEINIIGSLLKKMDDREKMLKLARLSDIFRYTIVAGLCSFITYLFIDFTMKVAKTGQVSAAMLLPSWIPDAIITFGLVTVVVHCIFKIIISIVDHDRILDVVLRKEGEE